MLNTARRGFSFKIDDEIYYKDDYRDILWKLDFLKQFQHPHHERYKTSYFLRLSDTKTEEKDSINRKIPFQRDQIVSMWL